jgi:hypothetical protein
MARGRRVTSPAGRALGCHVTVIFTTMPRAECSAGPAPVHPGTGDNVESII